MTELEQLTKQQLIEKVIELKEENQSFIQKNLDLNYLFAGIMATCKEYIDNPLFEKNRERPLAHKIVANEEFNQKYGLSR